METCTKWDEALATMLLEELGKLVRCATNDGQIKVPYVEEYHRRIVATHDLKDWDGYLKALCDYSRAAAQASYDSWAVF